jgi:hypothetical protein
VFTQLLQVLLQFAVAVRAANHHQRRTRIAHLDLLTHAALFLPRFTFCALYITFMTGA